MKKVNISYTTDIDNVPEEVCSLAEDTTDWVHAVQEDMYTLIPQLAEIESYTGCAHVDLVKTINGVRSLLSRIDLRLQDCAVLVEGYKEILQNLKKEVNLKKLWVDE